MLPRSKSRPSSARFVEASTTTTTTTAANSPQRETNPRLPSYAQTTISFQQHANSSTSPGKSPGTATYTPLKAGTGRRSVSGRSTVANTTPTSRPSSKRTTQTQTTTPLKKVPSFVDIFRGPDTEEEDGSPLTFVWKKSPGYKSPKLIRPDAMEPVSEPKKNGKRVPTVRDFQELVAAAEQVLESVIHSSEEKLQGAYTPKQLKELVSGQKKVSVEDWNGLVDYHLKMCERFQKKLETDYQLLQSIVELNREMTFKCVELQAQLDVVRAHTLDPESEGDDEELESTLVTPLEDNRVQGKENLAERTYRKVFNMDALAFFGGSSSASPTATQV